MTIIKRLTIPGAFAGAILLLSSGGCLSRTAVPPARYYALLSKPGGKAAPSPRFPDGLEVREFSAPRLAGSRFAAVDLGTGETTFAEDFHWADRPDELAAGVFADHLRASGLFPAVFGKASGHRPRYALAGRVLKFRRERHSSGEAGQAVFAIEAALIDAKKGEAIWSDAMEVRRPVPDSSPEAFAPAMSDAVNQAARDLTGALARVNLTRS